MIGVKEFNPPKLFILSASHFYMIPLLRLLMRRRRNLCYFSDSFCFTFFHGYAAKQ
jgi:hypothetical protein